MKIKRPLTTLAGAFVLGEVAALAQERVWMGAIGLLFLVALFLWCRKDSRGLIAGLALSFCVCGFIRGTSERQTYEGFTKQSQTGQVTGTVRKLEEKELSWGVTLTDCQWSGEPVQDLETRRPERPDPGKIPSENSGDVLVWIAKERLAEEEMDWQMMLPGRKLVVKGQRNRPEPARNPGGFDYDSYYRSIGVSWQMFGEAVEVLESDGIFWKETVYKVRRQAEKQFERLCEPEDLGVFQAALLGEKKNLDQELRKLYQDNGIAHLLAISGLHISMIGLGLYRMLRKGGLGYGAAGAAGAVAILAYGELTGFSSSVFRAVFMLLCYMLAEYLGRTYDLLSAASLAAILLLLESPYLVFQAGFQLSFGAVAAIGGVSPWLLARLLDQAEEGGAAWKKVLIPGLSIQLITYPVILYHFYQFPLYGIFLNLLVIPLMTYVVLSGLLGLFASCFSIAAGRMAIGSGHYILALYAWLCEQCERLPGASIIFGRPRMWQLLVYYLLLGAVFWWISRGRHTRHTGKRRMAVFLLGVASCFFVLHPLPQRGLTVTFLDVGQGDGICIQANGSVILIDGGSSSEKKVGQTALEPFFKSQGIKKIHYAIVSHGDQDHINGLTYLIEEDTGIEIERLLLPYLGQGEEVYERLAQNAREKGMTVHWMKSGEKISQGALELACIYHGEEGRKQEKNEHSLVMNLSYGRNQVLLTGDMSEDGEWDVIESGILEKNKSERVKQEQQVLTCLKVAHHGSKYSTCDAWLEAVRPAVAVISCGEDNSYGHPHTETMERLTKAGVTIWQTRERGAIFMKSDGNTMRFDSMLTPGRTCR